jgi:hypothetical protein
MGMIMSFWFGLTLLRCNIELLLESITLCVRSFEPGTEIISPSLNTRRSGLLDRSCVPSGKTLTETNFSMMS